MHVLAVGYSDAYLAENAPAIRSNWPRVPLPSQLSLLTASASLGRELAGLLDVTQEIQGITADPAPPFDLVGRLARVGGGPISPGDLAVTVGWGFQNPQSGTMPGSGKVAMRSLSEEEVGLLQAIGQPDQNVADVFLNDELAWKSIPATVWEYKIGGHQVLKKWLSYREEAVLGRTLRIDEVREFTNLARRLTAIAHMRPALAQNYMNVKAHSALWMSS